MTSQGLSDAWELARAPSAAPVAFVAMNDPVWLKVAESGMRLIERHLQGGEAAMMFSSEMLVLQVYTQFPDLFRCAVHDQLIAVYEYIMSKCCAVVIEFPDYLAPGRAEEAFARITLRGLIGVVEYDRGIRRAYFSRRDVAAMFKLFLE